jgi:hypothetical protein
MQLALPSILHFHSKMQLATFIHWPGRNKQQRKNLRATSIQYIHLIFTWPLPTKHCNCSQIYTQITKFLHIHPKMQLATSTHWPSDLCSKEI